MVGVWQAWRERQQLRAAAERYAAAAWTEPSESDVAWLSAVATGGDDDRARWELRYCRRSLAVLVAERDALDDRTGAAVSHAMLQRVHADRTVPPERVAIAERQFGTRLARFREAIRDRSAGPLGGRLAQALLVVAGGGSSAVDPTATGLVEGYWAAARAELRDCFGAAQLPEGARPSEAAGGTRR